MNQNIVLLIFFFLQNKVETGFLLCVLRRSLGGKFYYTNCSCVCTENFVISMIWTVHCLDIAVAYPIFVDFFICVVAFTDIVVPLTSVIVIYLNNIKYLK